MSADMGAIGQEPLHVFWFRRDLRLTDNNGLLQALRGDLPVLPLFIFDEVILNDLEDHNDARVTFIHDCLVRLKEQLRGYGSDLLVQYGTPEEIWSDLLTRLDVRAVYTNRDYEPYARERDERVCRQCEERGVAFRSFKDQVIFACDDVVKDDGTPYTVYTPYMKKWRATCTSADLKPADSGAHLDGHLLAFETRMPGLAEIGFTRSGVMVRDFDLSEKVISQYDRTRNIPAADATTHLSVHLRFGTVGIREVYGHVSGRNDKLMNELIWREFFMQILYHFPRVVHSSFREKYEAIQWRNNEEEFERWKTGQTGFPIVDAGMRELNATGYMHNRVRMIVASFLCKHLLIDWRWGEAYFARRLLDYELSSNNGNWQWIAGTGCDASPYFRIFNPHSQLKKFDPEGAYVRKWIPEIDAVSYPAPMVDHKEARNRALARYKAAY